MSNLLEKLITYCKNVLKIKPNNESFQIKGEDSYICRTEYEEKIYRCIKAIQVDSRNFLGYWDLQRYYNLKFALLDLSRLGEKIDPSLLEEGITTLRKVIENQPNIPIIDIVLSAFRPNYPLADVVLGILLTKQGKTEEAIAYYQNASYKQTFKTHPEIVKKHWDINKKGRPDFLIPGFMKCGTTSLYQYLTAHPQVLPSVDKELYFFTNFFEYGTDFYQAHFPAILDKTKCLTGEASAIYLHHPSIAKKVFSLFPDIKLIVLLRNPIERTISSYSLYHKSVSEQNKRELAISACIEQIQQVGDNSVDLFSIEALSSSNMIHLLYSLYIYHLKEWLSVFPRDQFLILKSEDLFGNPSATMNQVYDFLGLPYNQLRFYRNSNVGSYSPISDNLRSQLKEFYRPYNQQLEEYLGMKFDWE